MKNEINPGLIAKMAVAVHPLGSARRAHVEAVIALAGVVSASDVSLWPTLVLSASYHDIGLAVGKSLTGFHAVDGADLARSDGMPEDVVDAVLHHTGSFLEMQLMRPDLADRYGREDRMMKVRLSRALTFCDLRGGRSGGIVTLAQRLEDIRERRRNEPLILKVMDEYESNFREIEQEFSFLIERGNLSTFCSSRA